VIILQFKEGAPFEDQDEPNSTFHCANLSIEFADTEGLVPRRAASKSDAQTPGTVQAGWADL